MLTSPLLEYSGWVWPNLKVPHSGYPRVAQPFGSRASARMSDQPMAFSGQPSAYAIGFQMAITTGERTRFFVPLINSPAPLWRALALASSMNAPDAGLIR